MCGIVAFTGSIDAVNVLLSGLCRLEYRGYDSSGIAVLGGADGASGAAGAIESASAANATGANLAAGTSGASQSDNCELTCVRRKGKVAELTFAIGGSTLVERIHGGATKTPAAHGAPATATAPAAVTPAAPATATAPSTATGSASAAPVPIPIQGNTGIGHTRWATHGVPSEANAHPHRDCSGKIAVVHNGIIENHAALRAELIATGHEFLSQTDTEVVAHLIEQCYQGNLAEAVRRALQRLSGSFALAVVHAEHPNRIVVTRNDSPLVLGSCEKGALAASDIPALIEHTRDVIYLGDRDLAILHANGKIECYDPAGSHYVPTQVHVEGSIEQAERGGYPDFMLKEIYEQPRVVRDTITGRFAPDKPGLQFDELPFAAEDFAQIDRIQIVACGTSYHAGLIGRSLIESWARLPVDVEVASEFRYRNPIVTPRTLVIAISQSGETADTLEAIKLARKAGAFVVGLTNVVGSRITLESNAVIYIKAHLEIAVAATKSFLAQVTMLTLLALHLGYHRRFLTQSQVAEIFADIQQLPAQIEEILADISNIEQAAEQCKTAQTALYIGRGVSATTCYEGALKLKEISYVHAEAFSAGEIKHGPIALIDPAGLDDSSLATPVIALAVQSATYDKTLANIEEVNARGAKVIALATTGDKHIADLTEHVIYIPPVRECLSPIVASIPLQLFARHIALARGCDVDQPRNLAKSVTVE